MNRKLLHFSIYSFFAISSFSCFSQDWNQIIKAVASDRADTAAFGYDVAISENFAVVGLEFNAYDESGLNYIFSSGAAYVFENVSGVWTQIQKIVPSDRTIGAGFGQSVDIFNDYIIVGQQKDFGAVYVFKNNSGSWVQSQKITPLNSTTHNSFGTSLAINNDNIIIGQYLDSKDENEINSLAGSGSAYFYSNVSGTWELTQKVVASTRHENDYFGKKVDISGDVAIIGAPMNGFDELNSNFLSSAGAGYIFKKTNGIWQEIEIIVASDRSEHESFTSSVAIDGGNIVVGIFRDVDNFTYTNTLNAAGAAYVFKENAGLWVQTQKIISTDAEDGDLFGFDVAIDGNNILIGARHEDPNSSMDSGSAYTFKNVSGAWIQTQKLNASDIYTDENFGFSVAIDGGFSIIGAPYDAKNELGVNPLWISGSVYFFESLSAGISNLSIQNSTVFGYKNTVSIKIEKVIDARINIIDILGNSVCKQDIIDSETAINLNLPTGIYIVELTNNGIVETKKVFV